MNNGFVRVAAACPPVNVADVNFNVDNIIRVADELFAQGVEVALFPELCITSYTCGDLFHQKALLDGAVEGLARIRKFMTLNQGHAIVVGLPRMHDGAVYNSAAFVTADDVVFVDKRFLPNCNEFYEKRWFASAERQPLTVIEFGGVNYGIEICEDLWAPVPPSSLLACNNAQIILNLSASNELAGKYNYLHKLVEHQSARCIAGYLYAGAGFGESTTDMVFEGRALIAENGYMLAERPRWTEKQYVIAEIDVEMIVRDRLHSPTFTDSIAIYKSADTRYINLGEAKNETGFKLLHRYVNPLPFVPSDGKARSERCEEIVNIQTAGLARRLDFIKARKLVVGVSGGLDSTLALLVACRAFDRLKLPRKGIIGITMPGFGTTTRTHTNAVRLMEELGVSIREISIVKAVSQHFEDIGQSKDVHDITYENSQARERTQILMDVANKEGAIVLGTGDLSELALGWATYNGDHMSMYGVNSGVPKTLVRDLVEWCAQTTHNSDERATLLDIVDTPISPELTPADNSGIIAQKTEDLVGPYELHDFFLYYTLRYGFTPERIYILANQAFDKKYSPQTIKHWLQVFIKRFFQQQFKRSCMPDGPKIGSVCLSPRGDWRMPSDASASLWTLDFSDSF